MTLLEWTKRHPIITHLAAVAVVLFLLCTIAMWWLGVFTQHGKTVTVPKVKGLTVAVAKKAIEDSGLRYEITDSVQNDQYPLGSVVEQDPKGGASAKRSRTVYLTINRSTAKTVALPALVDISVRQGLSILQSYGFENVTTIEEFSPYKDLILDVRVNGSAVPVGTRLPLTANITLTVGNGIASNDVDSLLIDDQPTSLEEEGYVQ